MRRKRTEKIYRLKNALFLSVLEGLAILGLAWFLRPQVSELEKRALAAFPAFTPGGLLDGSFAAGVERWYADTYPLREPFIRGAHALQALYGDRSEQFIPGAGTAQEPVPPGGGFPAGAGDAADSETLPDGTVTTPGEFAGALYVAGNSAYSLFYYSEEPAARYAQLVNRTRQALGGGVQVYSLLAPLSSGIMLDPALLAGVSASGQRDAIDAINRRMDPEVHAINAFDTLKRHNAEYLYFRTDHHWTALGAYYAYVEFCAAKGVAPHSLDQFEERHYAGFLGTFYSATLSDAMKNDPDTVTAYVPMGTNQMTFTDRKGAETGWNIIRDVEDYNSGSKYCCFAGSDQAFAHARNPQITDGSTCLVIKDSFGNAFIPFLIDHYEDVYWIDFRYYGGTLPDLVREKRIQDVIFCLDISNPCTGSAVDRMEALLPQA